MSRTTANIPLLLRIVKETTSIVETAQCIVRKVMQTGEFDVVDKGTNDLQTKADRAAQHYITSSLARQFPRLSIIGEEGENVAESFDDLIPSNAIPSSESLSSEILHRPIPEHLQNLAEEDLVVWIDPLDGTAEFAKGITEGVTVLVGLAAAGKAIGGVIGQPFYSVDGQHGRTIWGIPNVGYGGLVVKPAPKDRRIICTTRSHSNPRVESVLNALEPDEVLRVGGAGYKTILLMEGRANAYVFASAGCKKWDSCAPEAILQATGGIMTDLLGQHYQYHKDVQHVNEGGILATAPQENFEWYVKKIPA